jgi:hypothetical protein
VPKLLIIVLVGNYKLLPVYVECACNLLSKIDFIQLLNQPSLIKTEIIICPPAAGFKSGNRTRQNIGPIRGNSSGRPNCWGPSGGKGARLYAPCQSTVAWADMSHSSISNSNYSISNLSGIALPTPPPFS